jgi:adenine-specific DNA-methyltransferase
MSHASEVETSILMAAYPDRVRAFTMEEYDQAKLNFESGFSPEVLSYLEPFTKQGWPKGENPENARDRARQEQALFATKEKGERLITIATQFIADIRAKVHDFLPGSGTTAHAVLELNKQDGGNRRFILTTNNENNICEDVTFERVKLVMKGYTSPVGDKIDGLGGNLTYMKTHFIPKDLAVGLSDEAKLKLTHRANLLLSLKENTFTPIEATDHYEITASPTKITAVYFREDKVELETMLNKLLKIARTKPATVYIFAWEKGAYKTGIPGYPFDFQDIPEPIVEVYQSIGY